eukprot:CAMPEP_0177679212 /NCGR_PEP_ID=MMETSP0447-20121125/29476_1 /TAXON_ID=0 /ORGANISM="Stygamoeba regulata, Strain BSH-02190019" /LENGTH=948 /DNA_ID=CAMNT_0019188375 /DNA_START=114 /DNA_END=2960 /DNA_ORIENTATION=-
MPVKKAPRLAQLKGEALGTKATQSRLYYAESTKKTLMNTLAKLNPFKSIKPPTADSNSLTKRVGEEDMIHLTDLTEASLLDNLKRRYDEDLIYTRVHSILVAINPFKTLPIYSAHIVKMYVGKPMNQLPPHIFGVTEAAYSTMRAEGQNQSIIISGESGAGKSESCRLSLQFLSGRTDHLAANKGDSALVETMILETVPVLEALGNAKTVRNNNSSRFGKYIEIQFNKAGLICGARITQYLLEKSRVCFQAQSERNYHIFYQMTEGADAGEKASLKLGGANDYAYLKQSGCIALEGVDEKEEWRQFKQGLTVLKITEQKEIFEILAAILHLGNIKVDKAGEKGAISENDPGLVAAAELLQMPPAVLKKGLLEKQVTMGAEKITMNLSVEQASASRDALAKVLYSNLFDWLISRMNAIIHRADATNFMGILDIFGFENFAVNSFEQFCINFANERLQHFFNHHIFKMEQEEYDREKIDWSSIDFKDNQKCIDLIEGMRPPGILPLLDEDSRFPKATDVTFLQKITSLDKNPHWARAPVKDKTPKFGVNHYAGVVYYSVHKFLEKNRDQVPEHFPIMFKTNPNKVVQILFQETSEPAPPAAPAGKGARPGARPKARQTPTVGANFKKQLGELMQLLGSTSPFFVRCVKPNMAKTPNTWDEKNIGEQLAYSGMYETIKIRRMGYPTRYSFSDFVFRYKCLAPSACASAQTLVAAIQKTLKEPKGVQAGVSKVFMRYDEHEELEKRRGIALREHAVTLQTWWRMIQLRIKFLRRRKAATVVQDTYKQFSSFQFLDKAVDAIMGKMNLAAEQAKLEAKRREEEAAKQAAAAAAVPAPAAAIAAAPAAVVAPPPAKGRLALLEDEVARLQKELRTLQQQRIAGSDAPAKAEFIGTGTGSGRKSKRATRRRREVECFQEMLWTVMDGLGDEEIMKRALNKDELLVERTLGMLWNN